MGSGRRFAAACAVLVALAAGVVAASVGAAPTASEDIRFGVADDAGKYAEDGGARVAETLAGLGMTAQRWTLLFDPANPTAITEQAFVDRALPNATKSGRDVVVSLFQKGGKVPDPDAFCAWAAKVATKWPKLRRFIIGNEVNATRFWSPQKTAEDPDIGPRTYTALLGKCYDALKAVSSEIQVIGYGFAPRAVNQSSTKPLAFLRKSGEIYKASGRTKPLMDAIAVHPYPNPNAKPPPAPDNAGYQDPDFFGIPQMDRVKAAIFTAFNGTHQRTTANGLPIVIDEVGYQSDTTDSTQYTGDEVSPTVSDADQATYHARIAALYHCDRAITDVFYFGLYDEKQRNADATSGGWQAGVLRPNGDRKPAYEAVRYAIAAGCTGAPVTWTPPSEPMVLAPETEAAPLTAAPPPTPTPAPTTAPPTAAGTQAAADAALQKDLLALQGTFEENHPAAAIDGAAEVASFEKAALGAAARAIVKDVGAIVGVSTDLSPSAMPPAFWSLPVTVREAVSVEALALLIPPCSSDSDDHLRQTRASTFAVCVGTNFVWFGGTGTVITFTSFAGVDVAGSTGAVRFCISTWVEYYRVSQREFNHARDRFSAGDSGPLRALARSSDPNGMEICNSRALSARSATPSLKPVTIAAGRANVAAGGTVGVKVKRASAKARPGVVLSFISLRSKADPSKVMVVTLRPTVVTPSDIAKATKAWKAKVKKAKAKKKKTKKAVVKKTTTAKS